VLLELQKKRLKKAEVRFRPNLGYGLYSKVSLKEGELIHQHEEKAQYLVTKKYIEKEWNDPLRKIWFERYAYPATDNTWHIWSDNPKDWLQINHSCDPNSWLEGLNLVARRDIKKGEQITMDYSTFCCDNLETFQCKCKSKDCRGTVTGTDYLKPFVEKYSTHISDYVETKRKGLKLRKSLDATVKL